MAKNLKAFTLIELISTIVIIAIIVSVATISINQVRSSVADNDKLSKLSQLQLDLESYRLLYNKYPDSLSDLNNNTDFDDIIYYSSPTSDYYQLSFDLNKEKQSFNSGYNCISPSGSCHSSLLFDGIDDYIEIEQSGPLTEIESGEITILAWVKISDTVGEKAIVFTGGGWNRKGVFFTINGSRARFQIGNGSQEKYVSVGNIPINEWVLVGGMWKDGVIYHIVNDSIIYATDCSFGYYYNPNFNLSIGRVVANTGASQRFMKGEVSKVLIYNRALSAEEISNIYIGAEIELNLVGNWSMDYYSYCSLADQSPYANHGSFMPNCPNNCPSWLKNE